MKNNWFGEEKLPYVCTPLTGATEEELLEELASILVKEPDVIEWRADFYENVAHTEQVLQTAQAIYEASRGIPILFTIRSEREGGQPVSLVEEKKVALLSRLCETPYVNVVDYEIANERTYIEQLRAVTKEYGKGLLLSHHNFVKTPEKTELLKQLLLADFYGADIAKIAVKPLSELDVLALLEVTKEADRLMQAELVTISMDGLGSMSRYMGWMYGSMMTFAVGANSSAPGQIPIEELRELIQLTKQFAGVKTL